MNRYNYPKNPISPDSFFTHQFMIENHAVYWREVNDDMHIIYDFGHNARICMFNHQYGYEEFYCFASMDLAVKALDAYADTLIANPQSKVEPEGWHRHFPSHRRRENGDPKKEVVYY